MEAIYVKDAAAAIGPYCHAMKTGNLVYISGQAAVNPATKKLEGESIEEQTERTFKNISIILSYSEAKFTFSTLKIMYFELFFIITPYLFHKNTCFPLPLQEQ